MDASALMVSAIVLYASIGRGACMRPLSLGKQGAKYHSEKVTTRGGITFDSKLEERWYWNLKADPTVQEIEVHPKFTVFPALRKCVACKEVYDDEKLSRCPNKDCRRPLLKLQDIDYIADFKVTFLDGMVEVQDVKGVMTEAFRLKWKLFERAYPHLTLRIVTKADMRRR